MLTKRDSERIKQLALETGFDLVKITKPEINKASKIRYSKWLERGYSANMSYMNKNIELRYNPNDIVDEVKTVLILGTSYYTNEYPNLEFSISKYAFGRDYHKLIKANLKALTRKIKEYYPEITTRPFVDSAPVLERSLAAQSGLGWIGKNTCLINKEFGSFIFLSELFINLALPIDNSQMKNYCGNCTRCIDNCPTHAITEIGIDTNKCISYHTIENPELIPESVVKNINNQLFGCDICQDICPWNQKLKSHKHTDLFPGNHLEFLNEFDLSNMNNEEFKKKFAGTPFLRAGKEKLLKTIKQINFGFVKSEKEESPSAKH